MPEDKQFTDAEVQALKNLLTENIDMRKRKIVNAALSFNKRDYVTREEIDDLIDRITTTFGPF